MGPMTLWATEWSDGRMSVVSAPNLGTAFRRIDQRDVAPDELTPVLSMTLQITSRSHNNAPGSGHVQTARRKLEWSGPHSGARVTRPFDKGSRRDALQHDPALSAYQVWSCVIRGNELAVYTSDSFEAAHLEATAVFDPRVRESDVESVIERVEDRVPILRWSNVDAYAPGGDFDYCASTSMVSGSLSPVAQSRS